MGKRKSNGNGHKALSDKAKELLKLLKKQDLAVSWLSQKWDKSKEDVINIAAELSRAGFIILFGDRDDGEYISLSKGEEINPEAISITETNRKWRIAFISDLRMGSYQSQLSLVHWLYREVFEREGVNFAVVCGGFVAGRPTPAVLPDLFKLKTKDVIDYAVRHYPHSQKFTTYVVGGRRELSYKTATGFDMISAIASAREDLAAAGDLERTFNIRGVRIKVMAPWDDNSPKGLSYGLQKIVDNLSDDPAPHIVVTGGMHQRVEIPDYGEHGMWVYSVPSLHMQMRRQSRKGVRPRLGCLLLELEFNADGTFNISKGLKARHINLDAYAQKNDCFVSVEDFDMTKFNKTERQMVEWFIKDRILAEGELSRRLHKSKNRIRAIIARLQKKGLKVSWREDLKRYEFQQPEKTKFGRLKMKYEDVFKALTKSGGVCCTHYGSEHEMPEVVRLAYEEAARCGARRMFHAGDVTEGPGATGYRGHQNDVKFPDSDGLEDHTVSKWPRVKVKATSKNPIIQTQMTLNDKGQPTYKAIEVKEGDCWLQTDIIDGNHDCWAKMAIGHRPVRTLALRMPELLRYLGPNDGKISMDGAVMFDGVYHRLTHGDGGLGYTLSTKLQNHMKSHRRRNVSADKPTVLWLGNWHVSCIIFQDEVGVMLACFKSEDEFHLRKGLVPGIGMYLVEIYVDQNNKVTQIETDYRNYRHMADMNG